MRKERFIKRPQKMIIHYIAFFFLLFDCFALHGQYLDSSLKSRFLGTQYVLIKNKEDIPKSFFKAYKKAEKRKFILADINEEFNSTDIISKNVPSRKLIFGGLDSTNKFGFIFYDSGGQIVTAQILIFDLSGKKYPKFLGLYLENKPKNIEELKQKVSESAQAVSSSN